MEIRLNRPNLWRLSFATALVAGEGRFRYHLHTEETHVPSFGKYAIEVYTTSSTTTAFSYRAVRTTTRR